MMMMTMMKVDRCRRAYDTVRPLFHLICGNLVDGGNALWFGLAMFIISSVVIFFVSLQLVNGARTAQNRVLPRRNAHRDLDLPKPKTEETEGPSGETARRGDWRVRPTSYRVPGTTHGDWLREPEEQQRRRSIVT